MVTNPFLLGSLGKLIVWVFAVIGFVTQLFVFQTKSNVLSYQIDVIEDYNLLIKDWMFHEL